MKILHVINNLATAGAEKLLTEMLPEMTGLGVNAHVMISNNINNSKLFEDRLQKAGVKILNLNKNFYNPFQIIDIARLINKGRYDIIHAHLFPSQYWLALASFLTKHKAYYVKTEHSVFNERKAFAILKPLEIFIYNRYHSIIGITDQVTENLQSWLGRTKGFTTIHNGVNLREIKEAQNQVDRLKYKFLEPLNYNILMVGRFDGVHKDQTTLIKALVKLDKRFIVYFAGDGPYKDAVLLLAKELGVEERVHFLGIRNDVYALMHLVDLNVLCSKQEGLSGVTLESLASGRPFIGSDVSGIQEVVPSHDYLFPPENPDALSDKIREISSNKALEKYLISEAHSHIKKYDISHMIQSYMTIYRSILNQNDFTK